jgi:hypothetical protein
MRNHPKFGHRKSERKNAAKGLENGHQSVGRKSEAPSAIFTRNGKIAEILA